MKYNTLFIAFEGIDGSGKSVQFKLLKEALCKAGISTGVLDFPDYNAFFGHEIGRMLSGKDSVTAADIDPRSMSLWYACDRLKAFTSFRSSDYSIVLMNRSTMANAAYQGARSGDPRGFAEWVYELEFKELGIPAPDMYFIFDIPVSVSRMNVSKKGFRDYVGYDADVYEKDTAFLESVRRGYLICADIFPGSVVLSCADNESGGMRPACEISKEIIDIIKCHYPQITALKNIQ